MKHKITTLLAALLLSTQVSFGQPFGLNGKPEIASRVEMAGVMTIVAALQQAWELANQLTSVSDEATDDEDAIIDLYPFQEEEALHQRYMMEEAERLDREFLDIPPPLIDREAFLERTSDHTRGLIYPHLGIFVPEPEVFELRRAHALAHSEDLDKQLEALEIMNRLISTKMPQSLINRLGNLSAGRKRLVLAETIGQLFLSKDLPAEERNQLLKLIKALSVQESMKRGIVANAAFHILHNSDPAVISEEESDQLWTLLKTLAQDLHDGVRSRATEAIALLSDSRERN